MNRFETCKCGKSFSTISELTNHKYEDCTHQIISCKFKCGTPPQERGLIELHENSCTARNLEERREGQNENLSTSGKLKEKKKDSGFFNYVKNVTYSDNTVGMLVIGAVNLFALYILKEIINKKK